MRLRNKKTGVIGEVGYISTSTGDILVSNIHDQEEWYHYKSLAGLNAEWEDITEEPKTFFTIYYDGTISEFKDGDDEQIRDMKAIGNYFETKEEAELAVRKLKAWKRLKDKGLRFIPEASYVKQMKETGESMLFIACTMNDYRDFVFGDNADIKLLFGGEE